jgi:hypothetical protein
VRLNTVDCLFSHYQCLLDRSSASISHYYNYSFPLLWIWVTYWLFTKTKQDLVGCPRYWRYLACQSHVYPSRLLTNQLSLPWAADGYLTGQEISLFDIIRRFITVFTTVCHRTLPWNTWVQLYTPDQFLYDSFWYHSYTHNLRLLTGPSCEGSRTVLYVYFLSCVLWQCSILNINRFLWPRKFNFAEFKQCWGHLF